VTVQLADLYTGDIPWLVERTIYLCRHGSHVYGTNIATSDEDFRGIAIAPARYYLGATQRFDQAVQHTPDLTVFDLRKFIHLAAQCNPNVIEILFVDDCDVLEMMPSGERLREARQLFVTKRARHTFSGYAASQLKRIRAHLRWLKSPPAAPPERKAYGLPDRTLIPADQLAAATAAIQKQLDSWSLDFIDDLEQPIRIAVTNKIADYLAEIGVSMDGNAWQGAARLVGLTDNFIELLDKERRYTSAKREWDNYQAWLKTRNSTRAALEAKWGYDTKHGMHLVRLLRMAREILSTGNVFVKRPDAAELLSIRDGALPYEDLVAWAEKEDRELQAIAKASTLPNAPDAKAIDDLCCDLIQNHL
jgi:uncharacterized protein